MEWSQPTLIESILKDLGLVDVKTKNQPTTRTTPSLTTVILTSHEGEPDHDETKSFNYRQVIGKLLYLEKSTRPDIACAVHQCARFSANPKTKHAEAVKRIGRYLLATKDKGLIINPKEDSLNWSWNVVLGISTEPLPPTSALKCCLESRAAAAAKSVFGFADSGVLGGTGGG